MSFLKLHALIVTVDTIFTLLRRAASIFRTRYVTIIRDHEGLRWISFERVTSHAHLSSLNNAIVNWFNVSCGADLCDLSVVCTYHTRKLKV